jgi:hypothetical protein
VLKLIIDFIKKLTDEVVSMHSENETKNGSKLPPLNQSLKENDEKNESSKSNDATSRDRVIQVQ